jgi:bifunctional non-homologous end joining protein LigD
VSHSFDKPGPVGHAATDHDVLRVSTVHTAPPCPTGRFSQEVPGLDHDVGANSVGFYKGKEVRFAGSVRAGLVPQTRRRVHDQIKNLEVPVCPFINLPDKRAGAWGQGITADKMKQCRWLRPTTVGEIEFAEWTLADRLRGASFVGLRDDKNARKVIKET